MQKKHKKQRQSDLRNKTENKLNSFSFLKNIVILLISLFILLLLYSVPGYKSFYDNIIKGNLKIIKKVSKMNPNISTDKKLELKFGIDGHFINKIKEATPEDAVILVPPDSIYSTGKEQGNLNIEWRYKGWILYYLYPRTIVKESEKNLDPNYSKVNYVCIINYWGYDKLNYSVPAQKRERYNILPVNMK